MAVLADLSAVARRWRPLVWLAISLLWFAACSGGPDFDKPPEIRYGEDLCERCQMIISEPRFAAAYVTADGESHRFDDVGEMLAYRRESGDDVAVFWVHDYETEEWLKADAATFVKSDALHTPMGFGIVAFASQAQAETWLAANGGTSMDFAGLLVDGEGMEHAQ